MTASSLYTYESQTGNSYAAAWAAVMLIADEDYDTDQALDAAAEKFTADRDEIAAWLAKINRS